MCYKAMTELANVDQAKEECMSFGADLPHPRDSGELMFIYGLFKADAWVITGRRLLNGERGRDKKYYI